jgi:hypothetical protein
VRHPNKVQDISTRLLARNNSYEYLERLGLDRVKHALLNGGFRWLGGNSEQQEQAWDWVRMKENQAPRKPLNPVR